MINVNCNVNIEKWDTDEADRADFFLLTMLCVGCDIYVNDNFKAQSKPGIPLGQRRGKE